MRRAVVALAAVALLAGCGSVPQEDSDSEAVSDNPNLRGYAVDLPDGRQIICVTYSKGNKTASLSCDWESVKKGEIVE